MLNDIFRLILTVELTKMMMSILGRGWVGHGCDADASNGKYLECEG